jgi:hypothetical protein
MIKCSRLTIKMIKIPHHNRWFTCQKKIFGEVLFSLSKMAIECGCVKGLVFKKKE